MTAIYHRQDKSATARRKSTEAVARRSQPLRVTAPFRQFYPRPPLFELRGELSPRLLRELEGDTQ
jgi:hypothetical protein